MLWQGEYRELGAHCCCNYPVHVSFFFILAFRGSNTCWESVDAIGIETGDEWYIQTPLSINALICNTLLIFNHNPQLLRARDTKGACSFSTTRLIIIYWRGCLIQYDIQSKTRNSLQQGSSKWNVVPSRNNELLPCYYKLLWSMRAEITKKVSFEICQNTLLDMPDA